MRLRPHGWGRIFTAAFLGLWLCGWVVGEGFGLWILGAGVGAWIMGEPFGTGGSPLEAGPAIGIGSFLLVWLAFWTLGGVATLGEFLRLVWGEDCLTADSGGLRIVRSRGPFRYTREYPRDSIVGILIAPRDGAIALETSRERIVLSNLGTPSEREEAARALRGELALSENPDMAIPVLPKGWEEAITPEGDRALVPEVGIRRTQSRVAAGGTIAVAAVALFLFREAWSFPALLPAAILVTLAAIGLAWGTAWLSRGRMEWHIGNGRLNLHRRFGARVHEVFEARRLEIIVTSDSDGDDWFALEAVREPLEAPQTAPVTARPLAKTRRRVASALHDPTVPCRLGAWLARAANVPLVDRSTKAARGKEIAALLNQLADTGTLGRFTARVLNAAQAKREKQS